MSKALTVCGVFTVCWSFCGTIHDDISSQRSWATNLHNLGWKTGHIWWSPKPEDYFITSMFCRSFQSFVGSPDKSVLWILLVCRNVWRTKNPEPCHEFICPNPTIYDKFPHYKLQQSRFLPQNHWRFGDLERGCERHYSPRPRNQPWPRPAHALPQPAITTQRTKRPSRAKQHRQARHCYPEHEANPSNEMNRE